MTDLVIQTGVQNLGHATKPAGGTRTHSLSTTCGTRTGVDVATEWDAASVLRD
jgi:hypothetical protein